LAKVEHYYALCVEGEEGASEMGPPEIAYLHLRDHEDFGRILGIAVYTAPEGEAQREDLEGYEGTMVAPVSAEDLLEAMQRGNPSSVFLDGRKLAGSVFLGLIKEELGIPIRHPGSFSRRILPQASDPSDPGAG
jgi:hypothetical protein